jgi:hypothetical protein
MRERFVPKIKAQGLPFDNGEFELIEEAIDTPWPEKDPLHFKADSIKWPESWLEKQQVGAEKLSNSTEK